MAFNLNPGLVLSLKSLKNWRGILRHRMRNQINFIRAQNQRMHKSKVGLSVSGSIENDLTNGVTRRFEEQSAHFSEHGWAFITDFFDKDIHQAILTAWPSISYFSIGSDPTKSYDKGPNWSGSQIRSIKSGIEPDFYLGFRTLLSEEFQDRVSKFCGDNVSRTNSGLGSAWARSGSLLLPHMDDVWRFGRGAVINFVIFIDGSSPVEKSGATAIYGTNTFDDPIFIPPTLQNTALVYQTGRFVYHGFPRVGRKKFSKRLIAQYSPIGQPRLSDFLGSGKTQQNPVLGDR